MNFETIDGLFNSNMNPILTLALAAILLHLGFLAKSKIRILEKYCIPAPVIGGFIFMFRTKNNSI